MATVTLRIWRGDAGGGEFKDYRTDAGEGMVVLDAIHRVHAAQAPDLGCRWNCKAGKCGSCSAEINGMPRLMCMTRLNSLDLSKPITVEPIKGLPVIKDLIVDMEPFFASYREIMPFLITTGNEPSGERIQSASQR